MMPVAFRYHLASIVAIFCALLIGMLVGIALVGDPKLAKQVAYFERVAEKDRATIRQLSRGRQREEQFSAAALSLLTRDRLSGKRVAVILTRDFGRDPLPDKVLAALQHAGASVTCTTTILDPFVELSREGAQSLLESLEIPVPVEGDLRSALAAKLAFHIAVGKQQVPYAMRKAGLLRVAGDYSTADDTVVLVGGAARGDQGTVLAIDLPMIQALQEAGIRCVGCESATTEVSSVSYYLRRKVPTVDNADTAAGQLALVLVVAGHDGNYGEKRGAMQLLPPLEALETGSAPQRLP